MRVLELEENKDCHRPVEDLSQGDATVLLEAHRTRVILQYPNRGTNDQWVLRSDGWVGRLPITPDLHLVVRPKVPVASLFGMIEYAYGFPDLSLRGTTTVGEIDDCFEDLAAKLARRILHRVRRGLYASYIPAIDEVPFVRGRLDIPVRLRAPWKPALPCRFDEHTTDNEENRILAWTLFCLVRGQFRSSSARQVVRQAFGAIAGATSLVPIAAERCLGRTYNRLNEDYRTLHALCRFFLDNTGPVHDAGPRRMTPFFVDMARLFEAFVAEWLKRHLGPEFRVRPQHTMKAPSAAPGVEPLGMRADIVVEDGRTGRSLCVLDTKYKKANKLVDADVYQAVAYAESLGCYRSGLVYPDRRSVPAEWVFGRNRVRTFTFDLSRAIDPSGRDLREQLLAFVGPPGAVAASGPNRTGAEGPVIGRRVPAES